MSTHAMLYGATAWMANNSHLSHSGKYKIQTRTGFEEAGRTSRKDYRDMKAVDCEHYYKALVIRIDIYEILPEYPDLPQQIAHGRVTPRINFDGNLEFILDIEHESGRDTYRLSLTEVEAVHKLLNWAMKYQRK